MMKNPKSEIRNPKLRNFKFCNFQLTIDNSHAGFTLLEVLVALTILSVGLLGVALMQVTSISGNTFSREMAVATQLGQDLLEKLRTYDYTSTTEDTALAGAASPGLTHPTANDVADNLAPAVAGDAANIIDERGLWTALAATLGTTAGPLIYTREWTVTNATPAANMKEIVVTVSWSEKGAVLTTRSITIRGIKVRS